MEMAMANVTALLVAHHKTCDADFVDAEEAARNSDWDACAAAFHRFRKEIETHFRVEEDILFPAFESSSGMRAGPTRMMRMEHMQMRALLDQLAAALAAKDGRSFLGAAQTLLIMLQQHNIKEEGILYPMCEQSLAGDASVAAGIAHILGAADG
jgi:iron-sulfur cluster repair protein YtfE (RIC family)